MAALIDSAIATAGKAGDALAAYDYATAAKLYRGEYGEREERGGKEMNECVECADPGCACTCLVWASFVVAG